MANETAKGLKILMSIRCTKKFAAAVAVASALAAASAASASIIEYTLSGVASGQWLNGIYQGQTFNSQAFTIKAMALTENVGTSDSNFFSVTNSLVFITLGSYGDMSTNTTTSSFLNRNQGRFGFGLGTGPSAALLGSFANGAFPTWDLQSSLGPVTGTAAWNTQNWGTTYGALRFSGTSAVTFTANVVPAPGAIALLGLAGLANRRRR